MPESYKSFSLGTISYVASPQSYPSFVVSNLSISPSQVEAGQAVTISVELRNDGGTAGSHTLNLLINGVLQDSREITLASQESKTIPYQVAETEEGDYNLTLDGQSGKFTVGPASPPVPPFPSWLSQHWLLIIAVIFFPYIFLLLVLLLIL